MARRRDFDALRGAYITLYSAAKTGPYRAMVERVDDSGVEFRLDSGDVAGAPYARISIRRNRSTGAAVIRLTEGEGRDG